MPKRGNLLSEFEQGVIQSLSEEKVPIGQIVDRLGRSYNCIKNYLLRNDSHTAARLIANLNLNVSKDTVYRFLAKNGYKFENFSEKNYSRKALWYEQE
ncbi:hypothetical protein A3Q56_07516 [Intoshia linei]|uniref:Tc3 transposase DNA binding domain-containing protein n=1 Tax=Intoshia linei TaxID=1819745 RepID=A0A177ARY2_9BILA|nr:hypothetical protein A3Q56_07516 [Intoshia linei]